MGKIKDIKLQFKSFVIFAKLSNKNIAMSKKFGEFRRVKLCNNNLLYLKKDLNLNVNNSGIENLGTDWMLREMGKGNFRFSGRFAWLFRHYIWGSRVKVPRANIVDIGCDVGEIRNVISRSFYIKNPYYLGIDLDSKRLSEGAEQIQMRIPAMYVQHDATVKFFFIRSGSVDYVFCGETIEHFEKRFGESLLKEIHRILKPGGKFLVSTPNADQTRNYDFHVYEYRIKEMQMMLEEVGFIIEKTWGWITTERRVLKSNKSEVVENYRMMKKLVHKDLVVSMMAYLDPDISEAFCIESVKPKS